MNISKLKAKWIGMVESYIFAYPNIKKAQVKYAKLLKFAEDNNLDFSKNLEQAVNYLDKNNSGLSFRHAMDSFKMK